MIRIHIQGLKDGEYEINLSVPVEEVNDIFSEFCGNVEISGILRKFSNRYTFVGSVSCIARMLCDRTLTEFEELITAGITASFLANTELFKSKKRYNDNDSEEIIIHNDEKELDITKIVKDQLAVKLPMKRIAPEFREKSFEELYPEYSINGNQEKIDSRWDKLKKLRIDN